MKVNDFPGCYTECGIGSGREVLLRRKSSGSDAGVGLVGERQLQQRIGLGIAGTVFETAFKY